MTIETKKVGKAAVMKLVGRMDADTSKQFMAAWDKLLEEGSVYLVADLSEMNYINSAGIGAFVRNGKFAKEKGGALLICGMKGFVKEIFTMTQMIRAFRIFDSTEEACKSIS